MEWKDLAEHAGVLVALIGFMALIIIGLLRGWWSQASGETREIWMEIKAINSRQLALRENLPRDFVMKNDLAELKEDLKELSQEIRHFIDNCQTGNCFTKRRLAQELINKGAKE